MNITKTRLKNLQAQKRSKQQDIKRLKYFLDGNEKTLLLDQEEKLLKIDEQSIVRARRTIASLQAEIAELDRLIDRAKAVAA